MWIASHVFILVCVVTMVNLGFWQLDRLDQRRASNVEILAATSLPVAPLDTVLPAGPATTPEEVETARFRIVEVQGTYRPDDQVLIPNRTLDGAPGYWVITPLRLTDGTAVAINRGWIPYSFTPDGPADEYAPATGTVTLTGLVRPPQVRASDALVGGPTDAAEGRLRTLARVDIARLDQQTDEVLWPLYLDLRQQVPTSGTLPVPVPDPELGEGPHLGYAGQWFIFAALTAIVYPLLLRRVARRRQLAIDEVEVP